MSSMALGALDIEFEIEQEIEKLAKDQVVNLVPADKIFFQAQVTEPIKLENQVTGQKLPYSQLNVDASNLERLYLDNKADLILTTALSLNVVMDELISDDIARLIEEKLTKSLRLNTEKRTISINRGSFAFKPLPVAAEEQQVDTETEAKGAQESLLALEAERARLEAEKARLETERSRLEVARTLGDTDKEKSELLKKIDEMDAEILRLQDDLKKPKEKTTIDLLQEFQLAILAAAVAIAIILASLLGFLGRGKGPDNVSQAIDHVAEGLNVIASNQSKGAESSTGEESLAASDASSLAQVADTPQDGEESSQIDQDKIAESIVLIEEKIKVLSAEGNFSFYSNLIELIESRVDYAAALIVATPSELARQLLSNIPPSYMEKMRNYLGTSGAVMKAKKMRVQALQEFYGKIALDEYIGSPLLEVNNIDWLLKLDNQALSNLIMELSDEDRTRLLACLSPSRVNLIIESESDQEKLNRIFSSLKNVKSVGFNDIPGLFDRMKEVYDKASQEKKEDWRNMVDAPRYLAEILNSSSEDKRERILSSLSEDKELMASLRNYFIPISDLALVRDNILKDIFASRSASQIAIVIYDMDEALRTRILSQLPEVLTDTVKEEMDAISSNEEDKVRNAQKSKVAKNEISRTLLKLYRDGIVKFDQEKEEASSDDGSSAVA